ncbi:hypothetical protein D3C86_1848060 [compost metagenome]
MHNVTAAETPSTGILYQRTTHQWLHADEPANASRTNDQSVQLRTGRDAEPRDTQDFPEWMSDLLHLAVSSAARQRNVGSFTDGDVKVRVSLQPIDLTVANCRN